MLSLSFWVKKKNANIVENGSDKSLLDNVSTKNKIEMK